MVLVLLVAVVSTVAYFQKTRDLATIKANMKQLEEIRRAFRDSPYYKRREGPVAVACEDPQIRRLLKQTIDETKDLRDKLNNPDYFLHTDRDEWKRQLRNHPIRILLQQQLQKLQNGQNQADPVNNWFVLDSKGLFLARSPVDPLSSIGKNFAWRTYFHGGDQDFDNLQDYLKYAAGEHVSEPHLSATLHSQHEGIPLWAVTAQVLDEKGEFVGVVGLRVRIGKTPESPPAPR